MSADAPPPPRAPQPPPPQVRQPPPPPQPHSSSAKPPHPVPEGSKSYVVTLVLSYLLGMFGADRFYLGKTGTALAKFFTLGGFGYWWLIDILITLFGGQRDAWGMRLEGYDRNKKKVWIVVGAIFGASLAIGLVAMATTAAFNSGGLTPVGWGLAAIVVGGAATAGTVWFFRRRARGKPARSKRGVDPVPPRIRSLLLKLTELRPAYAVDAAAGNQVAVTTVGQLDSLILNVTELFGRLKAKADKVERARADAEYADKLGKLAAALDRGYLLDMLANPRLWDEVDQRIQDVQHALEAVDAQLIDNIRQVNAHRGLVFKVAIDGLIGPRKAMDDWQRDFDRAAGTE